jgi:hypothetical protein
VPINWSGLIAKILCVTDLPRARESRPQNAVRGDYSRVLFVVASSIVVVMRNTYCGLLGFGTLKDRAQRIQGCPNPGV